MTVEDDRIRMDLSEPGLNRLTGFRGFYFCENEKVGSAEMVQGLPEDASREKMMISKAERGVNQEDVKISVKFDMLEPIIQNKSTDPKSLQSVLTVSESILSDENGNTLQGLCHEGGFITRLLG
jgi:hypothetical protein